MKYYQKLLVLMLTITLTLAFTTACKKKQASKEKSSDAYENVNNTTTSSAAVSSAEGKKKGDNKNNKYLDLLSKALELDSFYSEDTLYVNTITMEEIYWVKGNKIKVGRTIGQSTTYYIFDLDKKEGYALWIEDEGNIREMSEEEIATAKRSAYWNGMHIEYFSVPGSMEILTEREEDYNGFPCVYLEIKEIEGDTMKLHISKEYGVVMSYERYYMDTDTKLLECKRNHFEVGTVTDDEFELPSDINFQESTY